MLTLESISFEQVGVDKEKIWDLRPFQEYFTYIESIVNQRWTKTRVPGENHFTHRHRTWHLTSTRVRLEPQW